MFIFRENIFWIFESFFCSLQDRTHNKSKQKAELQNIESDVDVNNKYPMEENDDEDLVEDWDEADMQLALKNSQYS